MTLDETVSDLKPLAVTMGEPAGIGCEITAKVWLERKMRDISPFYLIADPNHVEKVAGFVDGNIPISVISEPSDTAAVFQDYLPILPVEIAAPIVLGKPSPGYGQAVLDAIKLGVEHCLSGSARALVTNPIQKSSLYEAGFKHPGHTEYLAELCGVNLPVMMLACPALRTVPVTIHMSLSTAIKRLTVSLIVETCRIVAADLQQRFDIEQPKLAVTGLNPHAGESGELGQEEQEIIVPAIDLLQSGGIDANGPFAADSLFHPRARQKYDVAICMYHDQALIPIKTINFDQGVNVTLGLPIIRTSPDHGTALALAGTGQANAESLIHAIKLASKMARTSAD